MSFPLVSILIPCYNHSQYVCYTLDSILADSYSNKEICIIDDGSSDSSIICIQQWIILHQDEIKIKFKFRENRGVSATLNELVSMSEGEFLIPCASDDMLFNDAIHDRVDFMLMHPNIKALACDAQVIDEYNQLMAKSSLMFHGSNIQHYKTSKQMLRTLLFGSWGYIGPILFLRRDVYELIGLYDESLAFEDHDFFLRLISKKVVLFSDAICAKYRIHTRSLSHNPSNQIKGLKAILKSYFKALRYYDLLGGILLLNAILCKSYLLLKVEIKKKCNM